MLAELREPRLSRPADAGGMADNAAWDVLLEDTPRSQKDRNTQFAWIFLEPERGVEPLSIAYKAIVRTCLQAAVFCREAESAISAHLG